MSVPKITYLIGVVCAVVVFAPVFGVVIHPGVVSLAIVVSGFALVARGIWYRGTNAASSRSMTRAVFDSDGWRKDTFVMEGLEADGEALRECTEEAAAHGYRREPGSDKYAWRFTRDVQPG